MATYFTLIQQPIYHLSFCGNLLASATLDVHPYYLCICYLYPTVATQRLRLYKCPLFKAVKMKCTAILVLSSTIYCNLLNPHKVQVEPNNLDTCHRFDMISMTRVTLAGQKLV